MHFGAAFRSDFLRSYGDMTSMFVRDNANVMNHIKVLAPSDRKQGDSAMLPPVTETLAGRADDLVE